ncbi:MAG: AAA family ATPase [bacterium]|nr:AAA family ATPase [bacterium]
MKILLISDDKRARDRITAALGEQAVEHEITVVDTRTLQKPDELAAVPADLMVIEGLGREAAPWAALERIVARCPQLPIVVATSQQSAELLQLAMRSGVREVVNIDEASLRDVMQRMLARIAAANGHAAGKIIAFIPAKFSCGATFLATSLGYSLSKRSGKRVLLIDLNMEGGDAALFVSDKEPETTLADVCRQIQRLDASFLAACTVTPYPGFSVLAAPGDPESALLVKPEHLSAILHVAVNNYDYVILDVDRVMGGVSIHALDAANIIFVVIQAVLPYLRDARRLLKIFSGLGYSQEKNRFVVNRHDKVADISVEDIEKSLEVKISHVIPNSYRNVISSVNQGVPLAVLVPNDPVVHGIEAIADTFCNKPAESRSWINRMFNK